MYHGPRFCITNREPPATTHCGPTAALLFFSFLDHTHPTQSIDVSVTRLVPRVLSLTESKSKSILAQLPCLERMYRPLSPALAG